MSKITVPNRNNLQLYAAADYCADKKECDGLKRGKTTGLKLCHFGSEIFYRNYKTEATDEEILKVFVAEFPNREMFEPVAAYRGYFNRALHGWGVGKVLSDKNRLTIFRDPNAKEAAPAKTAAKKGAKKPVKKAAKKSAKKAAK